MSELIDREAAISKIEPWLYSEGRGESELNMLRAVIAELKSLPAAQRWVRCEEELPDDGEWAIFTNGKVSTAERFKLDAYNHFYPPSQWFDFEDAIAWMPLPELPKEDA